MVGAEIFHAAGYNVPGTSLLDLAETDLVLDPKATFRRRQVDLRALTAERVRSQLAGVARTPSGLIRAAAISWVPGDLIGGFDLIGRRPDDPNDRIPHQDRRSLRADWVLYAWLSVLDPSAINTLDSYVDAGGRKFVRHYHFDFGCSFGSSTTEPQAPHSDGEGPSQGQRSLACAAPAGSPASVSGCGSSR